MLRRIQRSKQLPEVAAEGWKIRSMMMSYAEVSSHKGHIAPELIVRLREGSGYRDLVEDLSVRVREFQGLPESVTGPGALVTRADMTRASEIAHRINVHVGNAIDPDVSQETLLSERRKGGSQPLRLLELNLHKCSLTSAGARALGRSARLGTLAQLSLSQNPLGGEGAAAILGSPALPSLRILTLDGSEIEELGALPATPTGPRLARLGLSGNRLGGLGLAHARRPGARSSARARGATPTRPRRRTWRS